MRSGQERGQVSYLHSISLDLRIISLGLRVLVSSVEMATRRPQDLDIMTVEKGGQRGHTGTTPNPDVKAEGGLGFCASNGVFTQHIAHLIG